MQRKTLHYAIDYAALGWRIGAQTFFHTPKKCQKLTNDCIDYWGSIVAGFDQSRTFNRDVVFPQQVGRNGVSNYKLHHAKILLVKLPDQVTLVSPGCRF